MKYQKIIVVVLWITLGGCNQFLDVKSDSSYVIPSSLQDIQAILDDVDRRMNLSTVPSLGESVSDNFYILERTFNQMDERQRGFYTWDYPEYFGVDLDWAAGYAPVFNANLALELLARHVRTQSNSKEWDNIMGSALFFRSFYFYCLLVQFGPAYNEATAQADLGIVLRLSSDFNIAGKRSSVYDCFKQITMDLEEAILYLPDYPQHVMRPSKGAAYALLSRLFLYKGDYEEALKYADLSLGLHDQLMDFNGDADLLDPKSPAPITQFNKETIFYAEQTPALIFSNERGVVDSTLWKSYFDHDLRRVFFFTGEGSEVYFKGSYSGTPWLAFGGLSTNEVYLNKAECLALLDRFDEAADVLNFFLTNRMDIHSPAYSRITKTDGILDVIRTERRKELVFRNLRFGDIKRYNLEGANIILKRIVAGKVYELEPNSPKYALPLPSDWIKFTDNKQN